MRPQSKGILVSAALAALVAHGAAMAQTPRSGGGAASGALGAAAQAKTSAPAASATVKPGAGGGANNASAPKDPQALAAAIAAGDIRQALELGASAKEVANMLQAKYPTRNIDANSAAFVRDPDGRFAIAYKPNPPDIGRAMWIDISFADYAPPGGTTGLPTLEEALGPLPPPPPPTPAMAAVGQLFLAGGNPQTVANAILQAQPLPADAPRFDTSTAVYVQGPDGRVGLGMVSPDGGIRISAIPGSENYPGFSNLPTPGQAFPSLLGPPPGR